MAGKSEKEDVQHEVIRPDRQSPGGTAASRMKAAFVTATGTDIGKTYITAGIIRALIEQGQQAAAVKPVMSGYDPAAPEPSDAAILLQAMGKPVTPETVAAIAPWRYSAPLSPDMAATREGRAIALPDLLRFCRAAIRAAPGTLLVEGVGGAMVPLNSTHTVRDWIAELRLPALLVAGTYLGAISHSLTTAEALLRGGNRIAAIILSESEISPVPAEETAAAIANFLPGIAVHIIPRHFNNLSFLKLAEFISAG
jgi:dethiobiotin synthetase